MEPSEEPLCHRVTMPRFLMIAPYFPPMGVVGAKRALHLVRHLPAFGWDPVVLTAHPSRENQDASLAEAVPRSVPVSRRYDAPFRRLGRRRARSPAKRPREKRVTFLGRDLPLVWPFDPYLADAPWAIAEAMRLVREHDARAVHVCADPFSAFFVGMSVRRRTGLPLVLDLRDPWSLQPGRSAMRPWATRAVIDRVERAAFRAASKVVLNTEDARDAYVERFAGTLPAERFTAIRNAFDPTMFVPHTPAPLPGGEGFSEGFSGRPITIVHLGYFRRFVPSRLLLEGVAAFVARRRVAPGDLVLRCVGGLRAEDEREVERLGLGPFVEAHPAVPYRETLPLLAAADVLAVIVEPRMGLCVPAKVYDYVGARRPILAITDNPEVARIVRSVGGEIASQGDPAAVATALERLLDRPFRPDETAIAPFLASEQARKMAAVLDEVTAA